MLNDCGILLVHLDEFSEGLDPGVRECEDAVVAVAVDLEDAVVAVAVDLDDAIFRVHLFGDIMAPVHALPEFPGDTINRFDGMNLVDVHDQAAWA
jgi:hypothetical protein